MTAPRFGQSEKDSVIGPSRRRHVWTRVCAAIKAGRFAEAAALIQPVLSEVNIGAGPEWAVQQILEEASREP